MLSATDYLMLLQPKGARGAEDQDMRAAGAVQTSNNRSRLGDGVLVALKSK